MIDFLEIPDDGENWELFARDFLQEVGFYIESSPDRGPDGGKDILVTERLSGNLGKYEFRWLVSCKHFAQSKKSVQEKDEINIQERLASFNADGFIGFYSTISSSGLNARLSQLRSTGKIKDFKIFDHKLIESYLLRIGYSSLMMRYLPNSYKEFSPLRLVYENYNPLNCHECGKDLLEAMYEKQQGIVVFLKDYGDDGVTHIKEVYGCCKESCDRSLKERKESSGWGTGWEEISSLTIPVYFLDWVFTILNVIRSGKYQYTDAAYESLKYFIAAISQKVVREMTEREKKRALDLLSIGGF